MSSLTFTQQLTLMIIDKLLIGLVILLVVFVGQRLLETYKARQIVWAEASKERIKHIAAEWNEMNVWDCIVGDVLYQIVQILVVQDPTLAKELSSGGLRPGLHETVRVLSHAPTERIKELLAAPPETLAVKIKQSIDQGVVVDAALQANRFWLGKDLYEHCRGFQLILHRICRAIGGIDLATLKEEIPKLEKAREDVLTTLKLIK